MAKRLYVVNEDRAVRTSDLFRERECRPRVNSAFNQRHVSLDVQRSVSEV